MPIVTKPKDKAMFQFSHLMSMCFSYCDERTCFVLLWTLVTSPCWPLRGVQIMNYEVLNTFLNFFYETASAFIYFF